MRKDILRKCYDVYKNEGPVALGKKIYHKLGQKIRGAEDVAATYERLQLEKAAGYEKWRRKQLPSAKELKRQRKHRFEREPLISVVIPVYNTKREYLSAMIDSVLAQTYGNWELCLADGASSSAETLACLDEYAGKDKRIRVKKLGENLGISGNTNEAIKAAEGSYIAFADHDDVIEPDALFEAVKAVNEQDADIIYTDEDKINFDSTVYYEPHLKPDYSPQKLEACNYFCHLMIVSKKILDRVGPLDSRFDGSQDHELALRACDSAKNVVHIPRVLYHWRQFGASMSKQHLEKCQACGRLAVKEHLERIGIAATIVQDHGYRIISAVDAAKKVSLITAAHKNFAAVGRKIAATIDASDANIDAVIVNLSGEKADEDFSAKIKIIDGDKSAGKFFALNAAAKEADGDFLLFFDENLAIPNGDWLKELMMYAQRPNIGAVGGKLFYADNDRIFATNYILTPKGPKREFNAHSRGIIGYGGKERITRNVSAVPIELMMIKREDFFAVGGFNAAYKKYFGDVDFCLRLLDEGKLNVFTPYADLRFEGECDEGAFFPPNTPDGKIFAENGATCFFDRYSRISYEDEGEYRK